MEGRRGGPSRGIMRLRGSRAGLHDPSGRAGVCEISPRRRAWRRAGSRVEAGLHFGAALPRAKLYVSACLCKALQRCQVSGVGGMAALGEGDPGPGTAGPTGRAQFLRDVVGVDEAAQMFAERRIAKPGNLLEGL